VLLGAEVLGADRVAEELGAAEVLAALEELGGGAGLPDLGRY